MGSTIIEQDFPYDILRRGSRDADKHSKRVDDAARKQLKDIISQQDIITSEGNKKVKVRLKYLDQFRFLHNRDRQDTVGRDNYDELDDGEVFATIDLASSLDPSNLSEAFRTASAITTTSQSQIASAATNVFDLASAVQAIDFVDAIESTGLANADMPVALALDGSLASSWPGKDIVLTDDAFQAMPELLVTDSRTAIPEPMTIWSLAISGLLLLCYRRGGYPSLSRQRHTT